MTGMDRYLDIAALALITSSTCLALLQKFGKAVIALTAGALLLVPTFTVAPLAGAMTSAIPTIKTTLGA